MASNPLPFLFEIEFRMIPIIPKHVRKRKRDCVNHAANGSSSKNSPPRVSANGRLLRKNWRQNAMIFSKLARFFSNCVGDCKQWWTECGKCKTPL